MTRTSLCLCACLAASFIFYSHESSRAAKPAKAKPVKKDMAAPHRKAAPENPDAIPKQRILKEFKAEYKPEDAMTVSVAYVGRIRRFSLPKNRIDVPFQTHQVVLVTRLRCGLKMREIWEVYYYRLETEWIFDGIEQKSSTSLNKPTARIAALNENDAKILISGAVEKKYGVTVMGITVQSMKGRWRLCTPEYLVTAKIVVAVTDEVYKTTKTYECLYTTTLARAEKSWEVSEQGCVYRGKPVGDCHIGTMCRETGSASTIPAITDEDATQLLRQAFENIYDLRKNNITVEEFVIIKRFPSLNYGMKIPCSITARFVMDEKREVSAEGDSRAPSYVPVRGVYECVVSGTVNYSQREKRWEGTVDTCCTAENSGCGWSCSTPYKGCRRLGEK